MDVISAVKPHACHSCDKSFGRRYNLRRHIDNVHTDEENERDSDIEYLDEPRSKKSRFYSETEDPETEPEENEDDDPQEDDSESRESDQSLDEHESYSELDDNIAYLD